MCVRKSADFSGFSTVEKPRTAGVIDNPRPHQLVPLAIVQSKKKKKYNDRELVGSGRIPKQKPQTQNKTRKNKRNTVMDCGMMKSGSIVWLVCSPRGEAVRRHNQARKWGPRRTRRRRVELLACRHAHGRSRHEPQPAPWPAQTAHESQEPRL
jgi:hypothetical protein